MIPLFSLVSLLLRFASLPSEPHRDRAELQPAPEPGDLIEVSSPREDSSNGARELQRKGGLTCVSHRAEARPTSGYDHWVHVTNACTRPVSCRVWTNVNPDAVRVEISPQTTSSLLTFRGSPAREFTANVECELR